MILTHFGCEQSLDDPMMELWLEDFGNAIILERIKKIRNSFAIVNGNFGVTLGTLTFVAFICNRLLRWTLVKNFWGY